MTKTALLLSSILLLLPTLAAAAPRCNDLQVPAAPASFEAFRAAVAGSLRQAGDEATAAQVEALAPERAVPAKDAALASCLLRRYTVARYGGRIVADLQQMVGFRTFEEEGKENWGLPEFLRQREWLQRKAEELGLAFKSYDGRVEEITLSGAPAPILAVLTHGDVQGVQGQQWASPPWEAKIVDGRIIGRGTEDDKGPIVASLYSLAALRDTGWPLSMTVRLLVANGEESSWAEIPYYLERAPKPDMTFGIDAAYPVVHAQKGFGVLTLRGKGADKPKKAEWWIVEMSGGSGMSIIPERGEAVLETSRYPEGALTDLKRRAAEWSAAHPPARLTVTHEPGDRFRVAAEGKGGHSSEPKSGHNALADLAAFLSTLNLRMDARGALVSFVASTVSTETNGRSLGVATHDEGIGDLTVNLSFLREQEGVPLAEINLRVPRGISNEEIQRRVAEKAAAFRQRTGAAIEVESKLMSEPHWAPPEGKLVASLLGVWEEVTGAPGKPIAIGGGTQARLFPGGVDFGPALEMDHYRGHGTDEYLTVDELHRIAELTVAAFWRLAAPGGTF
ncbi:MAG TPA: Sapep family Mn(2+)-dependent dipeptidase [Thermoanaerobaculia bacterium]|nr:Sapep family Mn(2+)-dependent dipeptidase [Thermoanaerobaculia bacterium]